MVNPKNISDILLTFSDSTPGPSNQPDAGPVTPASGPSENLESAKTLMPPAPQKPFAKKGNPSDSSSNNGGKGPKKIIPTPGDALKNVRPPENVLAPIRFPGVGDL